MRTNGTKWKELTTNSFKKVYVDSQGNIDNTKCISTGKCPSIVYHGTVTTTKLRQLCLGFGSSRLSYNYVCRSDHVRING